jgi:hypothetical protein
MPRAAYRPVDPRTQLYRMALHKKWDQMLVAHNTVTADELRQDQETGKLIAWKDEGGYVAVTASAGPVHKFGKDGTVLVHGPDWVDTSPRVKRSVTIAQLDLPWRALVLFEIIGVSSWPGNYHTASLLEVFPEELLQYFLPDRSFRSSLGKTIIFPWIRLHNRNKS